MFTHRNNEKDNERGALMIEAIALLGLMTMMSPMVVRQTADRTAEMEEVAIAGQMKEIKDALSNWIEANYQEKAKEFSAAGKADESFSVSAADLAPYLPATYLNGNQFRGNKLIDGFDVGVRAQCTEVSKNDGTECTVANNCYTLTNGAITTIPADAKCSRYKMTGVVLSKSDNNEEIDDRRASRIASMIGADGGYMRTKKLVESLYGSSSGGSGEDGSVTEMQKIVGSQGMWEGDVTKYIPGVSTDIGGKVAATTIFSSGFSGDYLYRKKVDGLPGANSMFTDLDMGGATECEGDGCHKINNAGGLEVVGGKILIRSQNTDNDQDISDGNSFAKIALATDKSHMHVNNSLDFSVGASISGNSVASYEGTHLTLNQNKASMAIYGGTEGNASFIDLNTNQLTLQSGHYSHGWASSMTMNKDKIGLTSGNDIIMNASDTILMNSITSFEVDTHWVDIYGDGGVTLNGGEGIRLDATEYNYANIDMKSAANTIINAGQNITMSANYNNGGNFTLNNTGLHALSNGSNANSSSFALTASNFTVNMGSASFTLTNSNFSVNIGLVNNTARHQMLLNNGRLSVSYLNAGNISDKYTVAYLASVYSNRAKLSVNADTGSTTGNNSIAATNARVSITTTADTGSGITPYYTHSGDTKYDHFRVDPSYMSVMNDIKITSRGGARLSEALPNYILKGIYELSNSYGSGPWPCGNGNCSFTVPYYTRKALGLSSGGWEFNCGGVDGGSHPIVNGGGTCTGKDGSTAYSTGDVVTFNYEKSNYTECPSGSFCWAHPFLGAVPAPGRKVSEAGVANADGLAAYDEGVCPDGYQAVLTVTPTVFELGKVQFVNSEKRPSDSAVSYNPGWQNYANSNIADVTGLMQMATKLGLIVEPITSGTNLYGWKIAMGTVTPTSTNTAGYIWNAGGIPANSWSAIAHTYCYFNPDRFEMPNMIIKDGMIQTADNPSL